MTAHPNQQLGSFTYVDDSGKPNTFHIDPPLELTLGEDVWLWRLYNEELELQAEGFCLESAIRRARAQLAEMWRVYSDRNKVLTSKGRELRQRLHERIKVTS